MKLVLFINRFELRSIWIWWFTVTGDTMKSIKVRKHECQERVIIRVSNEKQNAACNSEIDIVSWVHSSRGAAVSCNYFFLSYLVMWIYEVNNSMARVRGKLKSIFFLFLSLFFSSGRTSGSLKTTSLSQITALQLMFENYILLLLLVYLHYQRCGTVA